MAARLAVVAGLAFLATVALVPLAGRVASRLGLVDQPKPNRAHTRPTPNLGGVAILVGLVGAVVAMRSPGDPGFPLQLLVILLGGLVVGVVGLLDDIRPSPPRWRLLVETMAAVSVVAAGVRLQVTPWGEADIVVTVVFILGITNATNLLDNMDGLASGSIAIAATGAAFVAVESRQALVSVMAIALAAASAGFLVHNLPPARVFMGDAGALPLGFFLAVTVAKLDLLDTTGPVRLAIVMLLCGLGAFDTCLVVISRVSRSVSPFRGGTDHSSHRLVRSGLSPARSVLALHAFAALLVGVALVLRYTPAPVAGAGAGLAVAAGVFALVGLLRLPADGPLGSVAVETMVPAPAEPVTVPPIALGGE